MDSVAQDAEVAAAFRATMKNLLTPIGAYLQDASISEILVNGPHQVFVERAGRLERTDQRFEDHDHLEAACRNIAQAVGKRFVDDGCRIDGRLADGSRFHILHGTASEQGTLLSIRKFPEVRMTMSDLVSRGSVSVDASRYLEGVVSAEKNIVIAGSTGTGKTTVLGALAALLPTHLRVLVLEDSRELRLRLDHAVYLEVRPPDRHNRGGMSMRDLVHSALRLRPDRLIVGEVRGAEALELVTALSSGHGGSFTTIHASSPEGVVARLETLVMLALPSIGPAALRRQICGAIQVVVKLARLGDGSRMITEIAEIVGVSDGGDVVVNTVYSTKASGGGRQLLMWTGRKSVFAPDVRLVKGSELGDVFEDA